MSDQKILIFGTKAAPSYRPESMGNLGSRYAPAEGLRSSRVSVETTAANLKAVMEQVTTLISAAKDAVGELHIAHVDICLAIAADGSVGLIGTDVDARAGGTLTVRLQL
jgi:hypothetical protein